MKINKKLSFALLFIQLVFIIMISVSSCGATTVTDDSKELGDSLDSTLPDNKSKYTDCKIKTFIGDSSEDFYNNVSRLTNNWLLDKNSLIEIVDIQVCSNGKGSLCIVLIYREVTN